MKIIMRIATANVTKITQTFMIKNFKKHNQNQTEYEQNDKPCVWETRHKKINNKKYFKKCKKLTKSYKFIEKVH